MSEAANRVHGPKLRAMMAQHRGSMDCAVVIVTASDLAAGAASLNPHAQLVHRLKHDGRLVLPSVAITGGRDCGRYMRAAGMDDIRQALADAAHRNAHGVRTASVPLMA
ncbi:hypothetical protein TSOC_009902 [Tetrabaena socialis]|uniref:Uncharacterized protein n=1 Tax=Tetrabaena socialis TaxID=47790 RepID=A0A2J7ZUQ5_9CHLO|nr:hypothetical protein TSOC_009902 [Tetrabaena socialis]|eukprot:PNH03992.1 hypothetical protein TSOC_009902 [Tetrabaena socialis]